MKVDVSILVPARNEEHTLPTTLPTVLAAARALPCTAEVLVIAPHSSPVHTRPPIIDPLLRWVVTRRHRKVEALRTGAESALSDAFIFVDADVVVEETAFARLLLPMTSGSADVVAGRIDVLVRAQSPMQQLLERWASISMNAWSQLRQHQPEFLWALPGALYAIRRPLLPDRLIVPLVDDASIGLQAKETGASFAYARMARAFTPAPRTYREWLRQKYRSRRGWADLAKLRREDVIALERALRLHLAVEASHERTAPLMQAQDRVIRFAARVSVELSPLSAGDWEPRRDKSEWRPQTPGPTD